MVNSQGLVYGMTHVRLTKPVQGLPYDVGRYVPVRQGNHGWIWHVYKTIITIPEDAYDEVVTAPEQFEKGQVLMVPQGYFADGRSRPFRRTEVIGLMPNWIGVRDLVTGNEYTIPRTVASAFALEVSSVSNNTISGGSHE